MVSAPRKAARATVSACDVQHLTAPKTRGESDVKRNQMALTEAATTKGAARATSNHNTQRATFGQARWQSLNLKVGMMTAILSGIQFAISENFML